MSNQIGKTEERRTLSMSCNIHMNKQTEVKASRLDKSNSYIININNPPYYSNVSIFFDSIQELREFADKILEYVNAPMIR